MSLILAPCRARGSAIAVRRSLVILPPESSLHARKAILVFARAKMCGHLPLVRSTKCPPGKPQSSFPQFPSHQEISWASVGRPFPFFWHNLSTGRHDLVHDDLQPCEGSDSLQSKEILVGRSLVNVNFRIHPTIFCNLGKQ